ncbi:hypothetical protein KCP73_26290 [Salmonella enterica subsp. enterica]|nr:hypothetical protein KCP73_26290 [Salmonella enterica subsp. enterica]
MTQDEPVSVHRINVINDDVQVEDGSFVIGTPPCRRGKVIGGTTCASVLKKRSGHRSNHVILSINVRNMPGHSILKLGGTEARDGHWVERVLQ